MATIPKKAGGLAVGTPKTQSALSIALERLRKEGAKQALDHVLDLHGQLLLEQLQPPSEKLEAQPLWVNEIENQTAHDLDDGGLGDPLNDSFND